MTRCTLFRYSIMHLLVLLFIFLYANVPFCPPSSRVNEGKILTDTHWMGEGYYAKFTPEPESNTLGCWSTTFSQIGYYHRLTPSGISDYECSKGYHINENLNNTVFDWSKFTSEITDTTSKDIIEEVSRCCYYIATVVQKDFGTGKYVSKLPPIRNIEKQLNVDAKQDINYKGLFHARRK